MADDQEFATLVQNEVVVSESNCGVIVQVVVDDQLNGETVCEPNDSNSPELLEQDTGSPSDDNTGKILLIGRTVILIRRIKSSSHQIIKYLTILLLAASLSIGIYIIIDDHGNSLTSKDDYAFIQKFYKDTKDMLENHKNHIYNKYYDTYTDNGESSHRLNDQIPDKMILIPKIVAQAVISVIDLYGMIAVFFEHFYSVRDLVGFMSFLNMYLLLDYTQKCTPIRLVIESLAIMALITFSQKMKPLHSRPLFPCLCAPGRFIVVFISSLLPCSCTSCCINENHDPTITGQRHRLETFKLCTSAAILISFGASIYTFYTLYPHVDSVSLSVYVTAIVMNSVVSIFGFLATLTESYRSLNGHFAISLTCAAIIIILAFRLSPNAAWLLLPLATSAFSIYILTCLMRILYGVKDSKPYAGCKIFLLFWEISSIFLAPAFCVVTYIHYTDSQQNQIPAFMCCGLCVVIFVMQCLLLYGTLAEEYPLLQPLVKTFCTSAIVSIITGFILKYAAFPDTTIEVMIFVAGCALACLPVIPFFKYYIIEIKLFNNVMSEAEIWFIHRHVRKFFNAIQISQTVGNACSTGMHIH